MKNTLIIMILLLDSISYSQTTSYRVDSLDKTRETMSAMVGTWEHIVSVWPNGSTSDYWYEHTFNADSTSIGKKVHNGDTLIFNTVWFAVDTTIYLYTQVDTTLVLGDVVAVIYNNGNIFSVERIVGELEQRKTTTYSRKQN